MKYEYWTVLVICLGMLFLKSFAYGSFIRIEIAEIHNNKYFKKHKSKNFLVNYFYFNYFKEINKLLFIFNLFLPVASSFLFVTESFIFILNSESAYRFGYYFYSISVYFCLISYVFAMIYSIVTSDKENLIRKIINMILALLPIYLILF